MTPGDFYAWRLRVRGGITQREAARLLGKTTRMIRYYEAGVKGDGSIIEVPKAVILACWAIEQQKDQSRRGPGR